MSSVGEFFPYRTFPFPRYATPEQMLTVVREDTFFNSWSTHFLGEGVVNCESISQTLSNDCPTFIQAAMNSLEDYKMALGRTCSFEQSEADHALERFAAVQQKVHRLIERAADLYCLASDSLLNPVSIRPELDEAFINVVSWERRLRSESEKIRQLVSVAQ